MQTFVFIITFFVKNLYEIEFCVINICMNTEYEEKYIETKYLTLDKKIELDCGKSLENITVAYETYGNLNEKGDNAILVLHALTGDAHAAGYHKGDKKPGWWDNMIGSGKAFDTDKYFVICSNILGGCKGTTGPCSINSQTGKEWALDFPIITIEDTVKVQKALIDALNIKKIIVAGGSMGGMQAIEWSISYPEYVKKTILIATAPRLSAQNIAFNAVARNAILSDKNFNNGNYYGKESPEKGLAIARMIGHITYLSEDAMHNKFARKLQNKSKLDFDFNVEFQVESYLEHQGQIFVDRFDANSYLYISRACDYFDIAQKYGSLENAFSKTNSEFLVICFSSDWLFPPSQSQEIVNALMKTGKDVSFLQIESPAGHDAFLLEFEAQTKVIKSFLI